MASKSKNFGNDKLYKTEWLFIFILENHCIISLVVLTFNSDVFLLNSSCLRTEQLERDFSNFSSEKPGRVVWW